MGGVDALVCNVSALAVGDSEETWDKSFRVDMMHSVNAVAAAVPYLEKSASASIVLISSVSGFEVDFACPNNRYINDEEICQAITAMWAKVGVKAKLRTMPLVTYFPMIQRYEASIYMLGWGVANFDANYSLFSLLRTKTTGAAGSSRCNMAAIAVAPRPMPHLRRNSRRLCWKSSAGVISRRS